MGLKKSRDKFQQDINALMSRYRTVDEDFFEALEEVLISADVGFNTVMELTEELRREAQLKNITETSELRETIVEKMVEIYERNGDVSDEMTINEDGLTGFNGRCERCRQNDIDRQARTQVYARRQESYARCGRYVPCRRD